MKKLLLGRLAAMSFTFLFLFALTSTGQVTINGGPVNYPDIPSALAAAFNGDDIHVAPGTYSIPSTITVNKSVTINGGSAATTKLQVSGTGYRFLVTAPNAKLLNFEIEKTDAVDQNIIGVQGNSFELANNNIHGTYTMGAGQITRGVEVSAVSGVNIHNNTFSKLRQPGYINTASGTINNNYTEITRGWVVVSNASVNFNGNTWGSGANVNYYDIAILPVGANNYPTIATMSANNNDATIENQFYSPAQLSIVRVQAGSVGTDGSVLNPYPTISQANNRVAPGGKVLVAAGTYNEQVSISRSARYLGQGPGKPIVLFNGSVVGKPTV